MSQTATNPVFEAALGYRAAGLSVIPVGLDGLKRPAFAVLPRAPDPARSDGTKPSWKPYRERLATLDELRHWFGGGRPYGIALVCGTVSGGLECIDFDDRVAARVFLGAVRADAPALCERLSVEETPRGAHVWYRCAAAGASRKLARPSERECRHAGKPFQTLAETRGEGGYAIVAGSPIEVHQLRRPYRHASGPPLTRPSEIPPTERDYLLRLAASFDRGDTRPAAPRATGGRRTWYGPSPADDYDLRGEPFSELLPCATFSHPGTDAGSARRPGKVRGWSATVGYCRGGRDEPLLKVFTSSWPPFEPGRCYGRFHVLRLTRFGGDGAATLRWLRERGFGSPSSTRRRAAGITGGSRTT